MKSFFARRLFAVVLAVVCTFGPSVAYAAAKNADKPKGPRERVVRVIKQIWTMLVPTATQDGITPPRP
jgi:hypothetical protein